MSTCGRLLWILRDKTFDEPGEGETILDINEVADYLDVRPNTIRRYINECLEKKYFQYVKLLGKGKVFVRYSSYLRIAHELGVTDLGLVTWCDRSMMRNLKASITIGEMKAKQDQSIHQAKLENKERRLKSEIKADWDLSNCDRLSEDYRRRYRGPESLLAEPKTKKGNLYKESSINTFSTKPKKRQNKPTVVKSTTSFTYFSELNQINNLSLEDIKSLTDEQVAQMSIDELGFIIDRTNELLGMVDKVTDRKKLTRRQKKVILHRGSRFVIGTQDLLLIGASQSSLGADLGRCNKTIRNRLKGIKRKQLVRVTHMTPEQAAIAIECHIRPLRVHDETTFELGTNVYDFKGIETSSAKKYNWRLEQWKSTRREKLGVNA